MPPSPPPSSQSANPDAPLISTEPTFAGHQTFPLRASWLKKGFDALGSGKHGGAVFSRPDAIVTLGVGKNMTGAIRHWLLTTGMASDDTRGKLAATPLGQRIFEQDGWDPYLEDEATLWILHARLCGMGSSAFSWVYAFNLLRDWEWTREELVTAIVDEASTRGGKVPSRETVDRDVTCLLQSYALTSSSDEDWLSSPLRALGLVAPLDDKRMRFVVGDKASLPSEVFAWALVDWWQRAYPQASLLAANEICYAPGSPGCLFKLDENSVFAHLDALDKITGHALRLEDTAQTPQVIASKPLAEVDSLALLAAFYARHSHAQSLAEKALALFAEPASTTDTQRGAREAA